MPKDALVVRAEPEEAPARAEQVYGEIESNHDAAKGERLSVPLEDLLLDPEAVGEALALQHPVSIERLDIVDAEGEDGRHNVDTRNQDELRRELTTTRSHDRALAPLVDRCNAWLNDKWRVVIACSSPPSAARIKTLLFEYDLEGQIATDPRPVWHWSLPGRLELRVIELSEGFTWHEQALAVVTDEEIFGVRQKRKTRTGWREGQQLEGIAQLAPGDSLVHADHGIGIYRGLMELAAGGSAAELLAI